MQLKTLRTYKEIAQLHTSYQNFHHLHIYQFLSPDSHVSHNITIIQLEVEKANKQKLYRRLPICATNTFKSIRVLFEDS